MRFEDRIKKFLPEYEIQCGYYGHHLCVNFDSEKTRAFDCETVVTGTMYHRDEKGEPYYQRVLGKFQSQPIVFENGPGLQYVDNGASHCNDESLYKKIEEDGFASIITAKEWENCLDYYTKKYKKYEEAYRADPVYAQLKALDDPEVQKTMTPEVCKQTRAFYLAKLKEQPGYQALQEMKKDVAVLTTYVQYRKKQEKADQRSKLSAKLSELRKNYNSKDMKAIIPDEKQRMAARVAMRKKLEKDAGM